LFAAAALLPAQETPRVQTSRPAGTQLLKLPKEDDAFGFIVFGDRTGGPVDGIKVLAQAVADTNLLDPDLVFTVGDLINGYNADAAWQAQAAEFKATMGKLKMPWFPVAGNHDIYWRGEGKKPAGEHETNFEATFGPLWYAVQHKQCCFVALYSDEGNPATGEKDFNKPECQRISEAQFAWLGQTLQKAKGARHVFVFLHHPRWLAQYGDDWDRVHALLAKNGNVTAVFAGHIHRMRYDGSKDGIQYYTVASVGAFLEFEAPQAGYLHQFHVVTVRPGGITVAALPVGTVIDAQQITGKLSEEVDLVHTRMRPALAGFVAAGAGEPLTAAGAVDAVLTLRCDNPSSRPVEYELIPAAGAGWHFAPDHQHVIVPARQQATTTFVVRRAADPALPFVMPKLEVRADYLAADRRIALPVRTFPLELPPPATLGQGPGVAEGVLVLDGRTACVEIPAAQVALPDGPFTVECWLRGEDFRGRRAIVARTQSSEFGLYGSDGQLDFLVHLDGKYVTAKSGKVVLAAGKWHHVAGVFDGSTVRCFVDGQPVGEAKGSGKRKANSLPLFVGADPDGDSTATSFFAGSMDEVRLSRGARYAAAFTPAARHAADADTVLLLHCDQDFGPWTPDASGHARHGLRRGSAHCTAESRPAVPGAEAVPAVPSGSGSS
ncbi:MAG: LamG-like jellyroll fold domain-containing protein, partial [Planctomycetota bacterium]